MAGARRMTLRSGHHVFQAAIDNLHWLSRFDGQQRRMRRDHRGVIFLATESSACFHLYDPHAICRQAAEFHQSFVYIVGALQRSPHGETALRIKGRDHPIVLYVQLFLCPGHIFSFDDIVGLLPHAIDITFLDQNRFEGII